MARIISGMLVAMLSVIAVAQQQGGATPDTASGKTARSAAVGNLEVLSDTQGVDFGPYLSDVVKAVRTNWYKLIPAEAKAPEMRPGKVAIEFVILPDGHIAGMKLIAPSGDVEMDRAAWGGITASVPFAALPPEFRGPYLALRFRFYYNPKKAPPIGPIQDETQ